MQEQFATAQREKKSISKVHGRASNPSGRSSGQEADCAGGAAVSIVAEQSAWWSGIEGTRAAG